MTTTELVEHFFRHEYAKLVATLSCRIGVQYTDIVEDAVQSALMTGLESWTQKGLPQNPSAWLFKVAHNRLLDELRQRTRRDRILNLNIDALDNSYEFDAERFLSGELQDDMLRMLFVCCNEAIPIESQLVFALKTLCGFNVAEIATRLFTTQANIYKRLSRARDYLRKHPSHFGDISRHDFSRRLPAVNKTLYLLFTEGYLSCSNEVAIRRELCLEAIRLTTILAENSVDKKAGQTFALLALMHLHLARMSSRQDAAGGLLLLEEQDRTQWDQQEIQTGLMWLGKSAQGEEFSRYHAEAGIAVEHCLSPSFEQTRWDRVVECYSLLEQVAPSAIHRLNRAVAVAEWKDPAAGLAVLNKDKSPGWLTGSYLWSAVLADLHRRCGNQNLAESYRDDALKSAPTPVVQALLRRRLQMKEAAE